MAERAGRALPPDPDRTDGDRRADAASLEPQQIEGERAELRGPGALDPLSGRVGRVRPLPRRNDADELPIVTIGSPLRPRVSGRQSAVSLGVPGRRKCLPNVSVCPW